MTVFHGIYGIFPGKFAAEKRPVFSNYGAFPGSKFSGEYTVNPVKYDQPPVNLRKICKRTVNWPLICKMYGHFPVNSRFPALFFIANTHYGVRKITVIFYSVHYGLWAKSMQLSPLNWRRKTCKRHLKLS